MSKGISVVIPSYNGKDLLAENLPSIRRAADAFVASTAQPIEILVVDDGGADDTAAYMRGAWPEVRLLRRAVNGGFASACNTGFRQCRHSIVALLNNDVRVAPGYFLHLAPHFQDDPVFAVTARVFEWDQPVFATGGKVGRFRKGFWSAYFNYDAEGPASEEWEADRRLLSFYAVGGFAAYDRIRLLDLGGFLEVLSPFHWEDIDLSYRGWKRGWEVRYEPRSIAFHRTSATIHAYFAKRKVEEVATRNRLLFHWINCHDRIWLAKHLAMLGLLVLTRVLVWDMGFYRALRGALKRLSPARRLRRLEKSNLRRGDREVARLLADFYRSAPIRVYYNRAEAQRTHPGPPRETPGS